MEYPHVRQNADGSREIIFCRDGEAEANPPLVPIPWPPEAAALEGLRRFFTFAADWNSAPPGRYSKRV